ncbi:MAG: alkaline ceramidase, partial [Pseudomonadota bacterium]
MIPVGVATGLITPPPGRAMAGFVARTLPATGANDPLTVRALAVGDTALVTADVIGLDAALCRRVQGALAHPDGVLIAATHTHGGPATMPVRLAVEPDTDTLAHIEAT